MRKLSVVLGLGLLLSSALVFAERRQVQGPSDRNGNAAHPWAAGARYTRITNTAELNPVDGPVVVLGVLMQMDSIPSALTYVQLRDTDTASDASVNIVARIPFASGLDSITPQSQHFFPIYLESGLAVDLSAASNGQQATVLWLDVRD